MTRYRAEMATNPSPGLTYYEGTVEVVIDDEGPDIEIGDAIFRAAVRELQRTAFRERGANCWRLISYFAI